MADSIVASTSVQANRALPAQPELVTAHRRQGRVTVPEGGFALFATALGTYGVSWRAAGVLAVNLPSAAPMFSSDD